MSCCVRDGKPSVLLCASMCVVASYVYVAVFVCCCVRGCVLLCVATCVWLCGFVRGCGCVLAMSCVCCQVDHSTILEDHLTVKDMYEQVTRPNPNPDWFAGRAAINAPASPLEVRTTALTALQRLHCNDCTATPAMHQLHCIACTASTPVPHLTAAATSIQPVSALVGTGN